MAVAKKPISREERQGRSLTYCEEIWDARNISFDEVREDWLDRYPVAGYQTKVELLEMRRTTFRIRVTRNNSCE